MGKLIQIRKLSLVIFVLCFGITGALSQTNVQEHTNSAKLHQAAKEFSKKFNKEYNEAIQMAKQKGWLIREELPDGTLMEIQGLAENGMPVYYITGNLNAAKTISTNNVWTGGSSGFDLDGSGMTVGEWDGGAVLNTHQEYTGRVNQVDGATSTHYHSTHVAGTLIASGVDPNAKGMAHQANLDAYDWNDDESEMNTAAAGGLLFSNHSYGFARGWRNSSGTWYWYGDTVISGNEDYNFGFYDSNSQEWDQIAFDAPFYLIVKSAGNDRNDSGPGAGGDHYIWDDTQGEWVWSTGTREQDGGTDGYDCIGVKGVAKNLLTVGAVSDISGGYTQPSDVSMSSFSGWGPADDGRIKPDIVGNGVSLYSCDDDADDDYTSLSGTSMSSPNVTGSLVLLQEKYQDHHSGNSMRAATLKGLALHTADEAGSADGPDYEFGWGLMNTETAVQLLDDESAADWMIQELTLSDGGSFTFDLNSDGTQPLKVSICWTDPAGTPVTASLNPRDPMLVNDLDLNVTGNSTTYYPWMLDPDNPGIAATTGDNDVDNVEQVYIASPEMGNYTITVNHEGSLNGGSQNYALIISGANEGHLPDITFQADMRELLKTGFDPAIHTLELRGEFNNWESGDVLSPSAEDDSLYVITKSISGTAGDSIEYKYKANPDNDFENSGWESDDNRKFEMPASDLTLDPVEPRITYNPAISQDVTVRFSVNMDNAADYYNENLFTNIMSVWMNGDFVPLETGGWAGWNVADTLDMVRLFDDGATGGDAVAGDNIWTVEVLFSSGTGQNQQYKYSCWANGVDTLNGGVNSMDNEAGFGDNHSFTIDDDVTLQVLPTDTWKTQYSPSAIGDTEISLAEKFILHNNYPNPFNPETQIDFNIPVHSDLGETSLIIYNILGQRVKTLANGNLRPGKYSYKWNGLDDNGQMMSSGVYFYHLKNKQFNQVKKMMLIQ